jgi:Lon protease-like protein
MQNGLLPLFPLQVVLFPRTVLPLHIFEERYKEMINQCVADKSEFGVVQAGEKGILNTGCSATVERVLKQYSDGRMDVFTVGRRRFEIVLLNDEKAFLRGAVQFFDDDDEEMSSPELRSRVLTCYNALRKLDEGKELPDLNDEDPQLSFQVAQGLQDLELRQLLLASKSENDRLRQIGDFLPSYLTKQGYLEHMRDVAPRNGHSKTPPQFS